MKNLRFINPFAEKSKENRQRLQELRLVARLENKYKSQSYSDKFRPMKQVANSSSYLFNFYSFATGFVALFIIGYNYLFVTLPPAATIALAAILGAGIAMAVELAKRNLLSNFFKDGYFEGSWKKGYLAGLGILMAVSFALTIFAALNSPRFFTAPPAAVAIDTTGNKFFTDEIARKTAEIAAIRQERKWRGRLSNKDQKQINNLNSEISILQADFQKHKAEAAATAEKLTGAKLAAYNSKKDSQQLLLFYIALVTESLLILVFWFIEFYDWQAVKERIDKSSFATVGGNTPPPYPEQWQENHYHQPPSPPTATPAPATATEQEQEQKQKESGNKRSRIGFNWYQEQEQPKELGELKEVKTINVNRLNDGNNGVTINKEYVLQPNTKPCLFCGTIMEYKSVKKKFCSTNCRVQHHKEQKQKKGKK